jgi:hypothetical protein
MDIKKINAISKTKNHMTKFYKTKNHMTKIYKTRIHASMIISRLDHMKCSPTHDWIMTQQKNKKLDHCLYYSKQS